MIFSANIITVLLALLLFLVVGIALQIFLSRRPSRWPGLVLPGISFLFSLLILTISIWRLTVTVNGVVQHSISNIPQILPALLFVFLLANIPTLILLAIYFAARKPFRQKSEIDKMHIDDL